MNNVEIAKKLLESKGYNVSKVNESSYNTPVGPDDMEFVADVVTRKLKSRGYSEITTEDVIEAFRDMNDKYDDWWARGLRTKESERKFVYDLLSRLESRGITNVTDNTFSKSKMEESSEEDDSLKYISNLNGFLIYRKIENGKGVWFAKRQDDPDDKMFPITYQQARGFEEMPNPTEIEKLQRKLGKMLLPQDEGLFKKKSKAGDAMADLAKSAKEDADNVKATMEKFKKLNKKNEDIDVDKARDEYNKRVARNQNPNDPVGYPALDDEVYKKQQRAGEDREKAFISRRRKEEGAPDDYEYNGVLNKFAKKTPDGKDLEVWDKTKESEYIYITKPDDLVGKPNPKFRVTYSTAKGETTSQTIEATDEDSVKAIIRGRCRRRGKTPEFISIEKVSESGEVDKSKSSLKEAIRKAMTAKKEHLEVAPNDSTTTSEKVAYVKKMVEKAKNEGDEHSAWDIVDFLHDSMLLDKIPLEESKELDESTEGLDYEDMKYWNPTAIGAEVVDHLGTDATQEEIESEIAKIIDRDDPKFQRAVDKALRELEWDKESMNKDPMDGHKYVVSGSTPNVTETGTDYNTYDGGYKEDPKSAIVAWLKLSQEAPTAISIDTNKNANAQELLQWVVDNEEEFRSLCAKYKCPYKVDYMIDGCKQKLERPSNFETKYNYPDQIWPFAIG